MDKKKGGSTQGVLAGQARLWHERYFNRQLAKLIAPHLQVNTIYTVVCRAVARVFLQYFVSLISFTAG